LKLKYDELLSSFAINFNLRRYTAAPTLTATNYAARRTLQQAPQAAGAFGQAIANAAKNDGDIDGVNLGYVVSEAAGVNSPADPDAKPVHPGFVEIP